MRLNTEDIERRYPTLKSEAIDIRIALSGIEELNKLHKDILSDIVWLENKIYQLYETLGRLGYGKPVWVYDKYVANSSLYLIISDDKHYIEQLSYMVISEDALSRNDWISYNVDNQVIKSNSDDVMLEWADDYCGTPLCNFVNIIVKPDANGDA